MINLKLKTICVIAGLLIVGIGLSMASCNDNKDIGNEMNVLGITGVSIPSTITIVSGGDITLTGRGFALGDEMKLTAKGGAENVFTSAVKSVVESSVTFPLPTGISSGRYQLDVNRGVQQQSLGTVVFEIEADNTLPDREGMTIKGVVSCAGVGVSGVVVSDGYELTATDGQGVYYLPSRKETGFVFISVPGNYEVSVDINNPLFYQRLAGGEAIEQKDFQLTRVDNNKHVLLAMPDMHLAKRNNDIAQFENGILQDVNDLIASYQTQGTKVYGLTLGDQSWDAYWYENRFALPDVMEEIQKINCPVFNCMGNHDNDPYIADDWMAAQAFSRMVGPTYYSFNLGAVHYIVLDDIEYLNTGAAEGVIGARNYKGVVAENQIAWLKKDLATLNNKSVPLVIALHIPVHANPTSIDGQGNQTDRISLTNGSQLLTCLDGFTNVQILSGHTHINFTVEASEAIIEHNTAAICATWWWTGKDNYAGNHICKDGSPGGYGVWEMEGNQVEWYYKSSGFDRNYQFRTYDRNSILIDAATFAPGATGSNADALSLYSGSYGAPSSNNEVLINVWGYDSRWEVEVTEGGTPLKVNRVVGQDPLHIISYEAQRLNVNATPTSDFVTNRTAHLFKVTATSPNSTLEIKVTDRFGNIYAETMTRPKAFNCATK